MPPGPAIRPPIPRLGGIGPVVPNSDDTLGVADIPPRIPRDIEDPISPDIEDKLKDGRAESIEVEVRVWKLRSPTPLIREGINPPKLPTYGMLELVEPIPAPVAPIEPP